MARYKRRREVYKRDIHSYSIYPRIHVSRDDSPIRVNGIYTVTIRDVNEKGQGVAKLGNYTIYVYDATVGDKVKIKIVSINRNGEKAVGRVLEWLGRIEEY